MASNDGNSPQTIAEAVQLILDAASSTTKGNIKAMAANDLTAAAHFSDLGVWIRNHLGLWNEHSAALRGQCAEILRETWKLNDDAATMQSLMHPDMTCHVLLLTVWEVLQGTDLNAIEWAAHLPAPPPSPDPKPLTEAQRDLIKKLKEL